MQATRRLCLLAAALVLRAGHCDAADNECSKETKSNIMTLKKKLFCSYDPSVRPVKLHTNTTQVSLNAWLKILVFNEHTDTLEIHAWMIWKWKDEHLTWDKSEQGGLDLLQVLSSELWVPDVNVYDHRSVGSTNAGIPETHCSVSFQGNVTCVSPTTYKVQCSTNIEMWPFDSHNCSVRVGSWSYKGDEVDLVLEGSGIGVLEYKPDKEWELVDVNATRLVLASKSKKYNWINIRFEMRRHPGGQASSVVIPSVVMASLTLMTFWLSPESGHRVGLVCANMICHCLYMMYLGAMLPANGDDTPIIVTFFRDSFLLAAVSLLVTLCAASMNTAARAPPAWVSSITDGLLALPPGQLLLLGELDPKGVAAARAPGGTEDNAELVGRSSGAEGWRLFSTLLDRVFFIVCFLTLFILLCAYVP